MNGPFHHIPKVFDGVHVWPFRWPNHSLEFSRKFVKPIANDCGPVAWRIVILENPTFVWVHEVYEWLQMVSKQLNIMIFSQCLVQFDQRTQSMP